MPNKAMVAHARLSHMARCDAQIDNLLLELEKASDLAHRVTQVMSEDVIAGALPGDKTGTVAAKIFELNARINDYIDRYVDEKAEMIRLISRMTDAEEIQVLYDIYFNDKKWRESADNLHVCEKTARNIRDRALEHLGEIMLKKE